MKKIFLFLTCSFSIIASEKSGQRMAFKHLAAIENYNMGLEDKSNGIKVKKPYAHQYIVASKIKAGQPYFDTFLQEKINSKVVNTPNDEGETLLSVAMHIQSLYAVKKILKAGGNPSIKDNNGRDAFDKAVLTGDLELINLLNTANPDYNYMEVKNDGQSGISRLLMTQNHNEFKEKLATANLKEVRAKNLMGGKSLMDLAFEFDNPIAFNELRKKGISIPRYPMHQAAKFGAVHIMNQLYNEGYDLNKRHKKTGTTALMRAAEYGQQEAALFLIKPSENDKHGANVNIQNKSGNTALHKAAQDNRVKFFKQTSLYSSSGYITSLLIRHNADTTVKNKQKQTAYDCAVRSKNNLVQDILSQDSIQKR